MADKTPKGGRGKRGASPPNGETKSSGRKRQPPGGEPPSAPRRVARKAASDAPAEVTLDVGPDDILEIHSELLARVQHNPNASLEDRKKWIEDFCSKNGPRWRPVFLSVINNLVTSHNSQPTVVNKIDNTTTVAAGLQAMAAVAKGDGATTQAALRDQVGAAAGQNNTLIGRDIAVFGEWLSKLDPGPDTAQRTALTACYDELRVASDDPTEVEALLSHYRMLIAEVLKDNANRKESIIRMSRGAINAMLEEGKACPSWPSVGRLFCLE